VGGRHESERWTWSTGGDGWRWDQVSFPNGRGLTPPAGLFEPIRGFGMVWYTKLAAVGTAGMATDQEKGFCATFQSFEHALIFRSSGVDSCQAGMFNWATQASFKPVFISAHQDGTWKRY